MSNPWMTTNSGVRFDLLDPTPEMFNIDDIAHSLSQSCRYNGHTDGHYSVAEHCVLLADYFRSRQASKRFCLTVLLHESDEPYFGDMISPLKGIMPKFKEITTHAQFVASQRFGTIWPVPNEIHSADTRIRQDEIHYCMENCHELMDPDVEPLGIKPKMWTSEVAKNQFLGRYATYNRM